MKNRIIGYDLARAFAIFGMIIVNFKFALGAWNEFGYWQTFVGFFEGRASALFVVLAGIGITLMTSVANDSNEISIKSNARQRIIKRGLLLIAIGVAYSPIWSADILHFYGCYFLIAASFIYVKDITLIFGSIVFVLVFPVMLFFLNYDAGWLWKTYTYVDYWSIKGMIRNAMFNGFHPVFPWCAFVLFGMLLGRQNLNSHMVRKKLFVRAMIVWAAVELFFLGVRYYFSQKGLSDLKADEINFLFQTTMMPPMPQYIVAAGSLATMVIIVSLYCAERFADKRIIKWLAQTGRLSLTLYILHVVIGIAVLNQLDYPQKHSIVFSVISALFFCVLCVLFSACWMRFFEIGPLEWVFRKSSK